jgi:hypothetical protein
MIPQKQSDAFDAFMNSTRKNDLFDPKTTCLLHLAASMAVGCYP